jgi:hypothetical protein
MRRLSILRGLTSFERCLIAASTTHDTDFSTVRHACLEGSEASELRKLNHSRNCDDDSIKTALKTGMTLSDGKKQNQPRYNSTCDPSGIDSDRAHPTDEDEDKRLSMKGRKKDFHKESVKVNDHQDHDDQSNQQRNIQRAPPP